MTDKESVLVFVLVLSAGLFVLFWAIRKTVDFYARERIERLKRALEPKSNELAEIPCKSIAYSGQIV